MTTRRYYKPRELSTVIKTPRFKSTPSSALPIRTTERKPTRAEVFKLSADHAKGFHDFRMEQGEHNTDCPGCVESIDGLRDRAASAAVEYLGSAGLG